MFAVDDGLEFAPPCPGKYAVSGGRPDGGAVSVLLDLDHGDGGSLVNVLEEVDSLTQIDAAIRVLEETRATLRRCPAERIKTGVALSSTHGGDADTPAASETTAGATATASQSRQA